MKTLKLPGKNSLKVLTKLKKLNGDYFDPYPFVHSDKGQGCYFKDLDNNTFLDFSSQISSNPLGYNNPELKQVIKRYSNTHPIKYAGQDFAIEEHLKLLEELISITPKNLNAAFLINSGAEAVENAIKICMRKNDKAKFGISFQGSFHGRTLGALSLTNSKLLYKKNYFTIPNKILSYSNEAVNELEHVLRKNSSEEIAFVILEPIQGEGGYNIASKEMINGLRKITRENNIPLISDEVQSGMGRTGKWWAIDNFNITPDVMSAAKALQVAATISNRNMFPEPGAISSTWGGGHKLDLTLGCKTIEIIKKKKLLNNVNNQGKYLRKRLQELNLDKISNVRGLGLMNAFDLPNEQLRNNLVIECLKNGLVLLGCGYKGIRLIPPYIVKEKEIDEACEIIKKSYYKIVKEGFKHSGEICNYLSCISHT